MKATNLLGRTFGKLVVRSRAGSNKDGRALWDCLCECGKSTIVLGKNLSNGDTKSCGCKRGDFIKQNPALFSTHGMTGTPTHSTWLSMRERCLNTGTKAYPLYGGRGIRICERWSNFQYFLDDMGVRPKGTTLDRIDTNGHYEPGNCRWATPKQQARNRRNNRRDVNGMTVAEISDVTGIKYTTLLKRINEGRHVDIHPVRVRG